MKNTKYFIFPPKHAILMMVFGLFGCMDIPKPATPQAQYSQIPRYEINVAEIGKVSYLAMGDEQGKRVIFVHGTPGSADGWADYLMNVPKGYYYIAIDRPGFGQSGQTPVVSLELQAKAVGALLGEHENYLVGHSLGGPIAAKSLAIYGDKIQGAVIAAGSLDPELEKIHILQPLGQYFPFRQILPTNLYNANIELMGLKPELQILQAQLTNIKQKITIIHGTKDELVPYQNVAFMQKNLTNAQVKIMTLDGLNHFLPWNSYNKMVEAIESVQ